MPSLRHTIRTRILVALLAASAVAGVVLVSARHLQRIGDKVAGAKRTTAAHMPPGAGPAPAAPVAEQSEPAEIAPAPSDAARPEKAPDAVPPSARAPQPAGGRPQPQNPDARAALTFVGIDPQANAVWYAAINDPNLPTSERRDLIEDLNEDGFADPANVTAEELPLVISRLLLIEQLAPYAMDEVNVNAFAEAYKDLMNMFVDLTGQ